MFVAHPWHGIDPEWNGNEITGVVEIPKGETTKYEIDKKSGLLKLDRTLRSAFEYPVHYGFIPRSLGEDSDPLDILVVSETSIVPLCLIRCRVIGVMMMSDRGISDHKIIAVASTDVRVDYLETLEDIPKQTLDEYQHFFTEYTKLENKVVVVNGFLDKKTAGNIIDDCMDRYNTMMI